jgi:hypothetical protein
MTTATAPVTVTITRTATDRRYGRSTTRAITAIVVASAVSGRVDTEGSSVLLVCFVTSQSERLHPDLGDEILVHTPYSKWVLFLPLIRSGVLGPRRLRGHDRKLKSRYVRRSGAYLLAPVVVGLGGCPGRPARGTWVAG